MPAVLSGYGIHAVLTGERFPLTSQPRYRDDPTAHRATHMFYLKCRKHGIELRLTKPHHRWSNG